MSKKKANIYTNYQQRATDFAVGDPVAPFHSGPTHAGRVVAVYPAIGMVDVEFPHGNKRYPVEDLQVIDSRDFWINTPHSNSVPGGAGQVSVSGGPYFYPNPNKFHDYKTEQKIIEKMRQKGKLAFKIESKVVERFEKKALYWKSRDRKYCPNKEELSSRNLICPKCKDVLLKKCIYKRENGISDKLMGCPICLFLIKRSDILSDFE